MTGKELAGAAWPERLPESNASRAATYEVTLQIAAGAVQFRERINATTYTPPLLLANSYTVTIKAVDTLNASTTAVTTPTFQVVAASTYKPAPPTFVQSITGPQLTSK